jgi:hypothetical protein
MTEQVEMDVVRAELSPAALIPNNWNPNSMSADEYQLLKEHILEDGFIDPITARDNSDGTYTITNGEHRWRVAKDIGLELVPVDVLQGKKWEDDDELKLKTVSLNMLHGKMDPEKFVTLHRDVAKKFGEEEIHRMMGFTKRHGVQKLIRQVAKDVKDNISPEAAAAFEKRAREAKTINDLEKIIQHIFQEFGGTVDHNFMVFASSGKQHIYIAMSKDTHSAMKTIMKHSEAARVDINEVIGVALQGVAAELKKASRKKKAAEKKAAKDEEK